MRFRIDLKIFIFIVLFYFTKQIEIYGILMIFAIIHELGHLLAGLILGMEPEKFEVMPFGVSISFKILTEDYNLKVKKGNRLELKKIFVAFAGPITNIIMILITKCLAIDFVKSLLICYANLLIMLFNLLPIYPLDGGRILKSILYIFIGKRKAEKYTNLISKIVVYLITAISSVLIIYLKNIAIFLMVVFLWYLIIVEEIKYNKKMQILKKFDNYNQ